MKFNNLEELVKYIFTENIDISNVDIDFVDGRTTSLSEENTSLPVVELQATIECLSESPLLNINYGDENILYVQSYESLKNSCGAGKITIFDKEIMTNLCEMENEAHVTLPIKVGDIIKNVEFRLSVTKDTIKNIQLAKDNII